MRKIKIGEPFFDFFSWGHLASGVILWASSQHVCYVFDVGNPLTGIISLFVTSCAAWIWEITENTLFVYLGWKFEDRRDSVLNSLGDILFIFIGGALTWLIEWTVRVYAPSWYIRLYYWLVIVLFAIFLIVFHIHGVLFLREFPKGTHAVSTMKKTRTDDVDAACS